MLVYIVALLEALGYLSAVPVCAAFWLSAGDGLRFGVGVAAFERRFAMRRARRAGLHPKGKPKRGQRGVSRQLWRSLSNLRGLGFSLRGSLGLGDAAATALACGLLRSLAAALGIRADRVVIDVAPLFDSPEPRAELQGMIRVRTGQLITAVALSRFNAMNRRIAEWTSIRSKAS